MKEDKKEKSEDKEYFLATRDEKNDFLVYTSDNFKLSEIDVINMIKICLIEARSKSIGRKIIAIYRDSTEHRKHITQQRLNEIGITENNETKPTKERNAKVR